MRILLLTHRVPYPPNRGDRIRSLHLLKYLAAQHEVSLACTTQEPVAAETHTALMPYCRALEIGSTSRVGRAIRSAWSLARGRSATEGYFGHRGLAARVAAWAEAKPFDLVVCYCSSMYPYSRMPALRDVPTVVDLVDVDSQKWIDCAAHAPLAKRWLYRCESRRVAQLEREIVDRAAGITLVSDDELALLKASIPNATGYVVSNGVDLEYFRSSDQCATIPYSCVFVGVLNYAPNVDGLCWFAESIWPAVRARFPQARFQIVGKSPDRAIERLAALPGIELYANVPDVRPYLERSAVAIAPMRFARGVQNKVLEAMAMAKPVIATPQSLEGLHARPGEEVVVARNTNEWLNALDKLFHNEREAAQLGLAARAYVEKQHCWENCLQPFGKQLIQPTAQVRSPARMHRRRPIAAS